GELRCAPSPLTGDDLKLVAGAADDNRLNDAVGFDRIGELLELRAIDLLARLVLVGHKAIDVRFLRIDSRLRHVGNERTESLAEGRTFYWLHGVNPFALC